MLALLDLSNELQLLIISFFVSDYHSALMYRCCSTFKGYEAVLLGKTRWEQRAEWQHICEFVCDTAWARFDLTMSCDTYSNEWKRFQMLTKDVLIQKLCTHTKHPRSLLVLTDSKILKTLDELNSHSTFILLTSLMTLKTMITALHVFPTTERRDYLFPVFQICNTFILELESHNIEIKKESEEWQRESFLMCLDVCHCIMETVQGYENQAGVHSVLWIWNLFKGTLFNDFFDNMSAYHKEILEVLKSNKLRAPEHKQIIEKLINPKLNKLWSRNLHKAFM